jgi:hypothetical protein
MKKLQNNFTTPEQSKRLLELGVPADSADMYYTRTNPIPKVYIEGTTRHAYHTPCWSVGRLIEIYLICNEVIDNVTELHHSAIKIDVREFNIVEYIIKKLTTKVKKNKGFFSKLEE